MARQLEEELLAAHGGLRKRRGRRLARALWLAPALAAAAVVVAVLAVSGGGGGTSIVARASAAVSADGKLVHYVAVIDNTGPSGRVPVFKVQVWESGPRLRQLSQQRHQTFETVFDDRRYESYHDGTIRKFTFPASIGAPFPCRARARADSLSPACLAGAGGGLLAYLRQEYGASDVHAAGQSTFDGRRVDVITASLGNQSSQPGVRVLVDARTFLPVQIQVLADRRPFWIMTIERFQRLPLTAHNKRLLELRPHPGARVINQ